jgi:hypothetical protein
MLKTLKRKPISALTVATPHRGSALAEIVAQMPERYRGSEMILRSFGYNIKTRRHFFEELTPSGLKKVFIQGDLEKPYATIRTGSIVCAAPRSEWCLPLKACYKIKAFDDFRLPSDGIVERDSQPWGRVVAEVPMDHFRQVGLFRAGKQFEFLTESIANYFKTS